MQARIFLLLSWVLCHAAVADIELADGTVLNEQPAWIVSYIEVKPSTIKSVKELIKQYVIDRKTSDDSINAFGLQRLGRDNHFALLERKQKHNTQEESKQQQDFRSELAPLLYAPFDQRLHVGLTPSSFDNTLSLTSDTVFVLTHADLIRPEQFSPCNLGLSPDAPCGNQLLINLTMDSRKHTGNLGFEILTQNSRTNHMTVMEIWSNLEAQQSHQTHSEAIGFRYALSGIDKNKNANNKPQVISGSMLGSLWDERLYKLIAH